MTSSAVALAGGTAYAYDAQDRLLSIAPPSGSALSFTLDALGRHQSKSVGGTLADTYGYAGASEAVVRIDQASASVSAAIDAMGNRVATATGAGSLGWTLPSLHGDMAALLSSDGTSISDAFRYDAYGVTIASATSALPTPWRYQGRLALNTADGGGSNTDLYDFVARAYDPALGAFTSLDTVAGSAQNPLTLNRFLYANANPTTLIDPNGHRPCEDDGLGRSVPTVASTKVWQANVRNHAIRRPTANVSPEAGPRREQTLKQAREDWRHYALANVMLGPEALEGLSEADRHELYDARIGGCAGQPYNWPGLCQDAWYVKCRHAGMGTGQCSEWVGNKDWGDLDGPTTTLLIAPAAAVTVAVAWRYLLAEGPAADRLRQSLQTVPQLANRGSTANLLEGTTRARNLGEQLAIEAAMRDPFAGRPLPITMGDPNWPVSEGWTKWQMIVNTSGGGTINVHYLVNVVTGEIDDFKIKIVVSVTGR